MAMLLCVRVLFLFTILRDVAPTDIRSVGTAPDLPTEYSRAINIQSDMEYDDRRSYDFQPGKPPKISFLTDQFQPGKPPKISFLMDQFQPGKWLVALMRHACPNLIVLRHLIHPFPELPVNPVIEDLQIDDVMIQDGAKYFKVIPAAVKGGPTIYISDISSTEFSPSYAQTPGQITTLASTSVDFDTMTYFWFPDPTDNQKLKLYLVDGSGRIETLVESNSHLRSVKTHSSSWKVLTDGFEMPEKQLQFILDGINEEKLEETENTPSLKSTTKFWTYSTDLYAAVNTGLFIRVFIFDWNVKSWTRQIFVSIPEVTSAM